MKSAPVHDCGSSPRELDKSPSRSLTARMTIRALAEGKLQYLELIWITLLPIDLKKAGLARRRT